MIETDDGLTRTQEALANLEHALRGLTAKQARYHPATFALIAEPMIDDIRKYRAEIDAYIGLPVAEGAVTAYRAEENGTAPHPAAGGVGAPAGA